MIEGTDILSIFDDEVLAESSSGMMRLDMYIDDRGYDDARVVSTRGTPFVQLSGEGKKPLNIYLASTFKKSVAEADPGVPDAVADLDLEWETVNDKSTDIIEMPEDLGIFLYDGSYVMIIQPGSYLRNGVEVQTKFKTPTLWLTPKSGAVYSGKSFKDLGLLGITEEQEEEVAAKENQKPQRRGRR